jgi:catechol 2,3-dioxygenase-like lactoylglutathione lyase family enzyme
MLRRTLLTLVAIVASLSGAAGPRPPNASVDSVAITVSDLDRSVAFYTNVLTFERVSEYEIAGGAQEHLYGIFGMRARTARMRLGGEHIELTEYLAPEGRPIPPDARSNDLTFQHIAIIVSDMKQAYARLRQHKVKHASSEPQLLPAWNRSAGGIYAFYFRDPDGHALEILQFPPDKGDSKWHRSTGRLFVGIDHTAITVSDTEASLRFYRDTLGLRVAAESENYGPEQERLNGVFGARLRITGLRAASGPGIEFLEYLAPTDGRTYPPDTKPNDIVHWHTRLSGYDTNELASALRQIRASFISSGVVELPNGTAGYRRSLLVRDPDGHAVQITD